MTTSSEYFEKDLENWLHNPPKKRIFLDLGAHIGHYTILAANVFKYEMILSVEPNPSTLAILRNNIELNGLKKRVITQQTALSNYTGTVKYQVDRHHLGGGSIVNEYASNPIPYIRLEVPITTIDSILMKTKCNPQHVDFVKIDVENVDYEVLQGMTNLLNQMPIGSCIMVEIGKNNKKTVDFLASFRFSLVEEKDMSDYLFVKK